MQVLMTPRQIATPIAPPVRNRDDIRTLAMLALSAYSFNVRKRVRQVRREPLMNLFATVLTYPAPSANYRGESEENRSVIQKITYGRFEYPIISPESIRNALRETLAKLRSTEVIVPACTDEDQLAVEVLRLSRPRQVRRRLLLRLPRRRQRQADRARRSRARIKESGKRDESKAFKFKRDSVLQDEPRDGASSRSATVRSSPSRH